MDSKSIVFWIIFLVFIVPKMESANDDLMFEAGEESKKRMPKDEYMRYPSDVFNYKVHGRKDKFIELHSNRILQKEQYTKDFENDLALPEERSRRNAIKDKDKLWPDKTILYTIPASISTAAKLSILKAIDMWRKWTCLAFSEANINDYNKLTFNINNSVCGHSEWGMTQGEQYIHLSDKCSTKVEKVAHEIGHAIGLFHEQSRHDRDEYVTVHEDNIIDTEKARRQFKVKTQDEYQSFSKPYDYLSIMHYGKLFLSKNKARNLLTITPKNESYLDIIGAASNLSYYDIKIVCQLYNCSGRCDSTCSETDSFIGPRCLCMCKGSTDKQPIKFCRKKDSCTMPIVDYSEYEVLNKNDKPVPKNIESFHDRTTFSIGLKDTDTCGNETEPYRCRKGVWVGYLPECNPVCVLNTNWNKHYFICEYNPPIKVNGVFDIEMCDSFDEYEDGENITLICKSDITKIATSQCKNGRWTTFNLNCLKVIKDGLWPYGRIPYTIDNSFGVAARLNMLKAMYMWGKWTCLTFVESNNNEYDKLTFGVVDSGCASSMIGRKQGEQYIYLSRKCSTNILVVLQEIGHAIGLRHEHLRHDRDEYVTVHEDNIRDTEEARRQFKVIEQDRYQYINTKPYDYLSIMHYGKLFFSKNRTANLLTMSPKNESYLDIIGKVQTISYYDAKFISQLYGCSARCLSTCSGTGFMGAQCQCMCRGQSDMNPIRLCPARYSCTMPTVDYSKYIVLNKLYTTVPKNSGPFDHGNTLYIEWNDIDACGTESSTYRCHYGVWIGDLPECIQDCVMNTNWKKHYNICEYDPANTESGIADNIENCFEPDYYHDYYYNHGENVTLICKSDITMMVTLECNNGSWSTFSINCPEELCTAKPDLNLFKYVKYSREDRTTTELIKRTCDSRVADYSILVRITDTYVQDNLKKASARVLKVFNRGLENLDENKSMITFTWNQDCIYPDFVKGKSYYVIAKDGPRTWTYGANGYTYPLRDKAFVIERLCSRDSTLKRVYILMRRYARNMKKIGCNA